ncbi:hypothetical protein SGPA1_30529 [Streptomyces misionensis JCM 4497]
MAHRRVGDQRARPGRGPPLHRHLGGGETRRPGHRRLARRAPRPGLEDGRVPRPRLAVGQHGRGVAGDPQAGRLLQGPGAGAAGAGGGADRLRHGRRGLTRFAAGWVSPPGPAPPRPRAAGRAG